VLNFLQSANYPCLFWRDSVIKEIYTDDTILTGPDKSKIDKAINDIKRKFEISFTQEVKDFLGVKIDRNIENCTLTLSQPQLIDSILKDLSLDKTSNGQPLPALSTKIMQPFHKSKPHNEKWSYRSVVGKLNYLEKSSRPDLAYSVHQCTRFAACPKLKHTKAIKLVGRCLLDTRDKALEYAPIEASFKCYADADFSGNWDESIAKNDGMTARSRSGYTITYAGCHILNASKLQTEIALSSTESEYISLSQALREMFPLMRLVNELRGAGFDVPGETPNVMCSAFEDSSGALEMARTHKIRPCTKHLHIKYHHFCEAVQNGEITIHAIDTLDQIADILTKPLGIKLFSKFRKFMMVW
jgi:hypothetical protein